MAALLITLTASCALLPLILSDVRVMDRTMVAHPVRRNNLALTLADISGLVWFVTMFYASLIGAIAYLTANTGELYRLVQTGVLGVMVLVLAQAFVLRLLMVHKEN